MAVSGLMITKLAKSKRKNSIKKQFSSMEKVDKLSRISLREKVDK